MPEPLRIAFLGCGYITGVHSQHLKAFGGDVVCAYASRDASKADTYCRRFGGRTSYGSYSAAISDPQIDAVVVAVPPSVHWR